MSDRIIITWNLICGQESSSNFCDVDALMMVTIWFASAEVHSSSRLQ
jgi:hypothetical protein